MLCYISRKINDLYILWLEAHNQFIQFAEPAYYVFSLYANNTPIDAIVAGCSNKYGLPVSESNRFVGEIINEIEQLLQSFNNKITVPKSYPNYDFTFPVYSTKHYKTGSKKIKTIYQSRLLEHYLHPLLSHLEHIENPNTYDHVYELFYYNNRVVLRHDGTCLGQWEENASMLIKGRFFGQMLNDMYNKTDNDWMATLHASAITNGIKTVAFSAGSGRGKSTLAALMHANGFQLIADDFVAVDNILFNAHPFPVAVSIKDGSLEVLQNLFPSLKKNKSIALSHNRSGRYLSHEIAFETCQTTCPLFDMIFVEYNPQIDFEMKPVNASEALQLIVNESWIQPEIKNMESFLQWLGQTHFYRLCYSNNQRAIEAISNMFVQ